MTKGNTAREVTGFQPGTVDDEILSSAEPLVLRGLAAEWPMVKAAKKSAQSAADYIRRFYSGEPLTASFGAPDIEGRVGYNDDLTGFNFERGKIALDDFLDRLFAHIDDDKPPASYVGSTVLNKWFPGFRDENDLVLQGIDPLASLWIGNQIRVLRRWTPALHSVSAQSAGKSVCRAMGSDASRAGDQPCRFSLSGFRQVSEVSSGARVGARRHAGAWRRFIPAEYVVASRRRPGWPEHAG